MIHCILYYVCTVLYVLCVLCVLHVIGCRHHILYLVSWLRGSSKEKLCILSHVAHVSDTAQVTRQVSLLGLIV